jgi:hypothetical protein
LGITDYLSHVLEGARITRSHVYVMGQDDSRNDTALRRCDHERIGLTVLGLLLELPSPQFGGGLAVDPEVAAASIRHRARSTDSPCVYWWPDLSQARHCVHVAPPQAGNLPLPSDRLVL